MAVESYTPIAVGVGDAINRSTKPEDAIEPLNLMLQAIDTAIKDTGLAPSAAPTFQSSIDSIDVVRSWTWPYSDLPGLLSDRLGISPKRKHYHPYNSGSTPGLFFDEAARRISLGENKVTLLIGGEALASVKACLAAKKMPPPGWTEVGTSVAGVEDPTTRALPKHEGGLHGIGAPVQGYPLFENGFRHHRGQTIQENTDESAKLYEYYAQIASDNPNAWFYRNKETAKSIKTVTKKNRMICFPYPLLMNAFNNINTSAAVLLTSAEYAKEVGIPTEKWIYALGGAGTRDSYNFYERPNFYSSPSISRSLDAAIAVSGVRKEDIDLYDFYSCFPIVPKIASHHLGLPIADPSRPSTLLGGLTFFGGEANNYSMHALTEMVSAIRAGKGHTGLVLANGGIMTYQHAVVLSRQPRRGSSHYPSKPPLPEVITDIPCPPIASQANGKAVIETYTVDFNRDNTPRQGYVIGRLESNGHRFVANTGDERTLRELCSTREQIGRVGWVRNDRRSKRNLFSLEKGSRWWNMVTGRL